jgi:hypothetical protein
VRQASRGALRPWLEDAVGDARGPGAAVAVAEAAAEAGVGGTERISLKTSRV